MIILDFVDKVISYEEGTMSEEDTVSFFQELIDGGDAWKMQGSYGRMAMRLIEEGKCRMLNIMKGAEIVTANHAHKGLATGGGYLCRLEGCTGWRIGVRWSSGRITFPCSKGMHLDTNTEGLVIRGRLF